VVFEGSWARATVTQSVPKLVDEQRHQLLERGVLVPDGDHHVFTQDFRFGSPSLAAGILVGGAANGRKAWRNSDGRTLKSIQDERAEGAS
jgi:hypothetical protein